MLSKYSKYKNSNISWINEIPAHWKIYKLKHVIDEFISGGTPQTDNDLFWSNENSGIPWVSIGDMNNKPIENTKKEITELGLHEKSLKILKKGTLLYSIFASLGKVSILNIDATTNQAILGLIHNLKVNKNYLKYYLIFIEDKLTLFSNSNTQNNLNTTLVKNMPITLPSKEEQKQIANYLDNKTSKIDQLIIKNKKLIDLLEEKRTSLINQVVTKGLNPNVKMKDSGIEWIGEIPEDWNIERLKKKCLLNNLTLTNETDMDYEFDYVDISSVSLERGIEKYEHMFFKDAPSRARRIVNQNDVIISTVRTYLKAIATIPNKKDVIVSTGFAVLTPKDIDSKYLGYIVKSEYFINMVSLNSKGISYPAINSSDLINLSIIIPPLIEQKEIVNYLDENVLKIQKIIDDINHNIKLLKEYKKSLIYNVVTGKVDIRGVDV